MQIALPLQKRVLYNKGLAMEATVLAAEEIRSEGCLSYE